MTPLILQLTTATNSSVKGLIRDYHELEHLQTSSRGTAAFVAKSFGRVKERLKAELEKFKATIIFADFPKALDFDGLYLLINPLDGINNLSRALPFFGIILTLVKKEGESITPLASVINLPASSEVFYAEKNQGAWAERSSMISGNNSRRLRCSQVKDWEEAFVSLNSTQNSACLPKFKANQLFGSDAYNIAQFASGKIDAALINKSDLASFYAGMLFSVEVGGKHEQGEDILIIRNSSLPI